MIQKQGNKIALIFIGISILVTITGLIIGFVTTDDSNSGLIITIGLGIGQLSGLIMLIRNGTIMKTVFWKIIACFMGLLIVGVIFKIQHWAGANMLISTSSVGIIITYSVRFLTKEKRAFFDFLKFICVITAYTGIILVFLHLITRDLMRIAHCLLWITIIYFIVNGYIKRTLFEN